MSVLSFPLYLKLDRKGHRVKERRAETLEKTTVRCIYVTVALNDAIEPR